MNCVADVTGAILKLYYVMQYSLHSVFQLPLADELREVVIILFVEYSFRRVNFYVNFYC